ncbi:formate--tetrahydrofolate ligase [Methylacidimicrobium cyclopophantes]|uniref:Formate--tetrahydrofolate ligase n=1 Tax=Methylacidimicrobium cyclopophantes TaxID=1041766 RepID=A0A5E6MQN2_9BACT|nr:formate--tetrahydrofolate ligase [Methylacidimicrobium cyclopophantes]VVM08481.1 formate--tetrahydrofolate ligase [Methylacidimicrobium cyclopophantes]
MSHPFTDLAIAQHAHLAPIEQIGARLGIPKDALLPYGRGCAKLRWSFLKSLRHRPQGRLILVTAITPTPAGEGKTTTAIGLADALQRLGQKSAVCLREPSIGPIFGRKGAATGAGRAQVVPREEINLEFSGDFAAAGLAHNLLSALLDNHFYQGNELRLDPSRLQWKRVVDINDRALRQIVVGLDGRKGWVRKEGFEIVAASEVMAILCLARDYNDLRSRLGRIRVGACLGGRSATAADLGAAGAMAAILRHAFLPNLAQTLEQVPAFIHGGPFGNIAHGCSSITSVEAAVSLADWVVTEAGFGSDLGGEKFVDIFCRQSGLRPAAAVIVATIRALKYHGGLPLDALDREDSGALEAGFVNLERHVRIMRDLLGLPVVVAWNRFSSDTDAELRCAEEAARRIGVASAECRHWAEGGAGAEELARKLLDVAERTPSRFRFLYDDDIPLWEKIVSVAEKVYAAGEVTTKPSVRRALARMEEEGFGKLPICFAKTQYSFSADPRRRGAPEGHSLPVREVRLAAGAGYVLALCGEILTMPGLPEEPASLRIDIDEDGRIVGVL